MNSTLPDPKTRWRNGATINPRKASEICNNAKRFVAERTNVQVRLINGRSREWHIVWSRWLAIHLAVKHAVTSKRAISREFRRVHGAIIHALRGVRNEIETNLAARTQVESLEKEFEEAISKS